MKKIFVCSPLRGNEASNKAKARQYCRDIALAGDIPIAPHIYFTQFLFDANDAERSMGIAAGTALLTLCDEVHVFGKRISTGMCAEIEVAKMCGIPVIYMPELEAEDCGW